jgi:ADP-ribose pyrophosphatase YjhB (NUDIX family)
LTDFIASTRFEYPVYVAKLTLEYSAGGVVLRDGTVLLIRTHNLKGRTIWAFPKGKLDAGETAQQAAVREVAEETGWRCRIEAELPKSEYWFQRAGQRVKKTVRWFRMTPVEEGGEMDGEVDEAAWVPIGEALGRLTYDSNRELLKQVSGADATDAR